MTWNRSTSRVAPGPGYGIMAAMNTGDLNEDELNGLLDWDVDDQVGWGDEEYDFSPEELQAALNALGPGVRRRPLVGDGAGASGRP
jgi:hypothetical protein